MITATSETLIEVKGELGFDNARSLQRQGEQLIDAAGQSFEMSLVGVTRAGSASVSLLLSWLRYAAEQGKQVTFSHIPDDLMGVARVSGIDQILPLKV